MAHETHTGCVLSRPEKEREEARNTAVCLIFVFFQDFENVGRTFGCFLQAEKQQLLAPRMEPAELDGSIRNVKPQLGRKTARNGMHVARVGSSARGLEPLSIGFPFISCQDCLSIYPLSFR